VDVDSRVFSLRDGVSFQKLGDEDGAVILMLETGQLYTCNATTATFLAAVDGSRTFSQLVDEVSSAFEVSREDLHRDLSQMAEQLVAEGLLQ